MKRKYLFISDFDKTLSIDDAGVILSARLGVSVNDFLIKIEDIKKKNITQLGGELAHLIVNDPAYKGRVTKDLLYQTGKETKLKKNVPDLIKLLSEGFNDSVFSFYVLSAAPQEIPQSALEGLLPTDHIFGSQFIFDNNNIAVDIERTGAGHAKVATVDMLKAKEKIPRHRIIYVGDGASDVHVMLHVLSYKGYTISVSLSPYMGHICRRTIVSENALSVLIPILEDILKYEEGDVRKFFEERHHIIQEWDKAKTEWVDLD
ncbi:MAG: haloacid dehalogenase-like hydrolase [Candidatus Omnitrophica bacterium]|nr:haloacid dehalogenase-like hydrolase [Candidatus Omnitrophota bacterium]